MLIDWFTVIAQLLNFLLLVWLLKRFLYKPILNAIDAREKDIAAKLKDADAKQAEARKEHDEFDSKNEAFDDQRNAIMAKATVDAKAKHDRLLDDAHKEADGLRASEAAALKNDQVHLSVAIKRMAQNQVFSIARKTLTDLATVSLEERIGEVFTRRLREMDGKGKDELGDALKSSPEASLVRSAFDLPAQQKDAIQNALNETCSSTIRIRYEVDANAIGGIELTANGQKLSWSISSYLDTFDDSLGKLLNTQAETGPNPPSTTPPEAVSESAPVAQ
jgi:F-type H+-transporting ATPase subunit b